LVIQAFWKLDSDARIDPPIHELYFLSGGAMTCRVPSVSHP
jgi:hypothetical protein